MSTEDRLSAGQYGGHAFHMSNMFSRMSLARIDDLYTFQHEGSFYIAGWKSGIPRTDLVGQQLLKTR